METLSASISTHNSKHPLAAWLQSLSSGGKGFCMAGGHFPQCIYITGGSHFQLFPCLSFTDTPVIQMSSSSPDGKGAREDSCLLGDFPPGDGEGGSCSDRRLGASTLILVSCRMGVVVGSTFYPAFWEHPAAKAKGQILSRCKSVSLHWSPWTDLHDNATQPNVPLTPQPLPSPRCNLHHPRKVSTQALLDQRSK